MNWKLNKIYIWIDKNQCISAPVYAFFMSIIPSKTKLTRWGAQTPLMWRPPICTVCLHPHDPSRNTELFVSIRRRPASRAAQSLTLVTSDPSVDVMDSSASLPSIRGLYKAFQMEGLTSDSGYTHGSNYAHARSYTHTHIDTDYVTDSIHCTTLIIIQSLKPECKSSWSKPINILTPESPDIQ